MPRPVLRTFAAVVSAVLYAVASTGAANAQTSAPSQTVPPPTNSAEPRPKTGEPARPEPATAPTTAAAPKQEPPAKTGPTPPVAKQEPVKPEPAKPEPTPPKGSVETPAVVIDSAETLLGKEVRSSKGDDLGRIVDVIIDRNGLIQAAIIDFGGFLGMGSRKIAVDWRLLHFPKDGSLDKLIADLPQDQLRIAPLYRVGEPVVVIGKVAAAPKAAPAVAPAAPVPPAAVPVPATPPSPAQSPPAQAQSTQTPPNQAPSNQTPPAKPSSAPSKTP